MSSINSIQIRNFRTYREAEIDFGSPTGVYLLSGDNGAGKSTFLNAINWCFYGDTPFFSIQKYDSIVNDAASDSDEALVQIFATIGDDNYIFTRSTTREQSPRSSFSVRKIASSGNSVSLDAVEAEDAVRRILPKEIRHLFFFNGEQLRDIYTNSGKEHNLKDNVYKVSEMDVLDNTLRHLKLLEERILRRITKQSRDAQKINRLKDSIESVEAALEYNEKAQSKDQQNYKEIGQKISDLDALISGTQDARMLLERKNRCQDELKDLNERIAEAEADKLELIQKNFFKVLLHRDFSEYKTALEVAEKNSLIPPPINPKVTREILESGICICGEKLSDEARARIQKQNDEYSRQADLQHLTDGIRQYRDSCRTLPDCKHAYIDVVDKLQKLRSSRDVKATELKTVNEQLEKYDLGNLPENPEVSRSNYENRREKLRVKLLDLDNAIQENKKDLQNLQAQLNKLIKEDSSSQREELLRQRVISLGEAVGEMKQKMEEIIRTKLQNRTWSTFVGILPESGYSGLKIDDMYNLSLVADGKERPVSLASTGEVKALGLSLVSALSSDLGYNDTPLLIDNLYGDLSEEHFGELTKMVSALSKNKQIIIMNLDIQRVESEFNDDVVKGEYMIAKSDDSGSTITEYSK